MLAECVVKFLDLETGELRSEGERFEVTPERLSAINSTRYGQLAVEVEEKPSESVSEPETATEEQPKPKRRGRKPKTEE